MPPAYQLLDVAHVTISQAIQSGGFYREPEVLAGVRHLHLELGKLITNYTRNKKNGRAEPPKASPSAADSPAGGETAGTEPTPNDDEEGGDI